MQINAQLPVIGLPDDDWHKFRWLQIEPIDLPIHGNYFLSTCKNFRAGGIPSEHFHFIFPANNFLLSKPKKPETKAVFRCKLEAHDFAASPPGNSPKSTSSGQDQNYGRRQLSYIVSQIS